jgi:hypothetical protein
MSFPPWGKFSLCPSVDGKLKTCPHGEFKLFLLLLDLALDLQVKLTLLVAVHF